MSTADTYHLSTNAAEWYERQKVPSLFGPMARATLDAVSLPEGAHIIDVACGTGIISKVAAERLAGQGRIVGTDLNPAMVEGRATAVNFGQARKDPQPVPPGQAPAT